MTKTKGDVEMSRYINLDEYHAVEKTHPYYVEMLERVLEQVRKHSLENRAARILELGAGTGIVTEELARLPARIDALDYDQHCCDALRKHISGDNVKVIQGDAVTYRDERLYDLLVSVFAHDHIHFDRREALAMNIADNLTADGLYIVGVEILPEYHDESSRTAALHAYHGHIIRKAKSEGHHQVAELEREALISGLEMIGDFKTHQKMFEDELTGAGLEIVYKEKMGPLGLDIGGVCVHF
jgi:2-polyprenyl-3-methyl-5-hydroxy-6-metoxy-1,4-benzoquinol methylase